MQINILSLLRYYGNAIEKSYQLIQIIQNDLIDCLDSDLQSGKDLEIPIKNSNNSELGSLVEFYHFKNTDFFRVYL